ncbi:HprK-related kinase A [Alteromonas sp. 1_MG-2023]|uniref:HprK-related kinase A n=1 Tax=Alteromonas sp. 1_MG-2023 TaxID=3062669 RepID=UPI0026E20D0C|nr:HprK-related kinase A [Alteromonas sp. 1_MG-2023]MDO6566304.1 HprK-related kinase A [Alteromonas sp. 1_MG-2023]
MKLGQLSKSSFEQRIHRGDISINFSLLMMNVSSKVNLVSDTLFELYRDYDIASKDDWFDFNVSVNLPTNLRRYYKPQAVFKLDENIPFKPLPYAHSYPLLEWGMNWCVANFFHDYLLLHAAVLEKDGKAIIFPAPPGSGKSTLCAYLALSGWRLLSDEMAVINLNTHHVEPFVRPICLKNNSISLVKEWFPDTYISPLARDTQKGNVAHVRPPTVAVENRHVSAPICGIVFPKFERGMQTTLTPMAQTFALHQLIENAFNFDLFEHSGFEILSDIIPNVALFEARYSDVQDLGKRLLNEVIHR